MVGTSQMSTVAEALAMREVERGIFKGAINSDYCYGDWAWGGYIASLFQMAAGNFVANGHADARRPDVLNVQIQHLRPVLRKNYEISIRVVRETKTFSTLHLSMVQSGKECNVGYVNLSNLTDTRGPSFDTKWELHPPPAPTNLSELETNTSQNWIRYTTPYTPQGWFRPQALIHFLLPVSLPLPSIADQWVTPQDPRNRWTNASIGLIADLWAPFVENFNPDSAVHHSRTIQIAKEQKSNARGKSALMDALQAKGWSSPFVLTTITQTLETKKRLPAEGVKWLFVRAYAKVIEKGKFDVEVVICDEGMGVVALGHQVALLADFRPEVRFKDGVAGKAKI